METKEYIVILEKGIDYNQVWADIESSSSGLPHIPDRPVTIINNLDAFDRQCAYSLTDDEAKRLQNDPRVAGVEIPIEQMPGVEIIPVTIQNNNFTKPLTSDSGNINQTCVNWGLIRNSNPTNVYSTGTTTTLNYNYILDGTGVDVVISDSGIQADHPEFQYTGNATSRVQQINWADYVPALSTMPSPYQDPDGHGTHVAGIAAGKTYGWAKGAQIYSIIATGPGQPTVPNQFAAIKLWHQSKGANGRPTVVNMSWASVYPWRYLGGLPSTTPDIYSNWQLAMNNFISTITSVTYRGTTYAGNSNLTSRGLLLDSTNYDCVLSFRNGFPAWTLQTEDQLQTLIDAGITVVAAAGNNSYKIDKPVGGTGDYDNLVYSSRLNGGSAFYQRGSSPHVADSINVGNQDSVVASTTLDQKVISSCTGPGVDVYAAGTKILSATTSNALATLYSLSALYFLNTSNTSYRQLNSGGTSMASPQIAGIAAIYLQLYRPSDNRSSINSSQVKSWITSNATTTMYSPGSATTYTNFRSTLGGNAIIAYQPITNLVQVKSPSGWQQVQTIKVKGSDNEWKDIKGAWVWNENSWQQVF